MRQIFSDAKLQLDLETDGFAQIALLTPEDCRELLDFHESLAPENEEGFYTSIWSSNREYREKVDRKLKSILLPGVNQLLDRYKPVFANFMVKRAAENSHLGLHQDWTFVDESQFVALNCWVPLVDTHVGNGPLRIVKRSNTFPNVIRGRNIRSPYDPIQEQIRQKYMTDLIVPAGTAIIFDERMLHDSEPNTSDQDRVAVSIVMVPREAEMQHYLRREGVENQVDILKVDSGFFTENGLFDNLDHLKADRQVDYTFKGISEDEFAKMYHKANPEMNPIAKFFVKLFS
ncbi:MAG: phytanoyl-CoA dioxygenase family protein [Bacteroidia bacterium]|nr:phytanoyl-CoA dioxygenase family protein [Bacteroidia bacterium]